MPDYPIIDTHAHLMFEAFEGEEGEAIGRAAAAGVSIIVGIGCGVESSRRAVEMADQYENLYATLGLHPYDADQVNDELLARWEQWILDGKGSGKIVAIGETGLDYFKSKVDPEQQQESFRRHLELARRVGLPVVVHNREADEDCLEILKEFAGGGAGGRVEAVFHCYGSDLEFARRVWSAGYMTSFTGIVTYPNADSLREVVKEVPLDKFMVETDSPYLAPQKWRGERNEPAYVVEVLRKIAEVKGIDEELVAKHALENSLRFFGIEGVG